jgi:uncharacterized protein YndB with AHSA1/START domain
MPKEFAIRKEAILNATPEQVWRAIATPGGLSAWFMPMPIGPDSDLVVVWEPGQRLLSRTPAGPDGATQSFEYLIEGRDGGTTVLRFVHSGMLSDDWSDEFEPMTSAGWDMYLDTLAAYFIYFADRRAQYIQAEGPASSADGNCWPSLLNALGASQPVELGAAVRIDLGGAGVLEGTIDYVTTHYVGLRTEDALIRFHLRAPIGMTVAISHHAYGDKVDGAALTEAWTTWLAGACG